MSDDNVVAWAGDEITGVIDFGDVATSWTVAELAVTCAAVLHHDPRDPLAVLDVIAGFAEVLPLTDPELDALWPLMQLRAAVLIVSGEQQVALDARGTPTPTRTGGTNGSPSSGRGSRRRDDARADQLETGRPGGDPGDSSAGRPPVRRLGRRVPRPVHHAATCWMPACGCEEGIEDRLAETCRRGRAAVTAWGEARLTRAEVLSAREVPTVPLGCEVRRPPARRCGRRCRGNVRQENDAVVLEGTPGMCG